MSLIQSLKLVLARPHPAARPFLLASGAAALAGRALPWRPARWLGTASGLFFGFCLYFFRDPERVPPVDTHLALAPADGHVVSVEKVVPPDSLDMGDVPVWRVATFLSVLDVHVNRMPAAGTVTRVAYHPGQFLNASLDKASELNERNALRLTLPDGRNMAVVQIAGLIARRILCDAEEGMTYEAGERFGLIRFGSRTDLYLPPGVEPLVTVGQTMVGGETVMARL
ncbi:phosphatidylserine decarboxylase related protein [Gluconacetobacter diazotrophicus PA1 5]|uniref:Phosphatidylserine decarboxylase proenzyme n=2 Tax=Gluconacetobacter diazotrophicus TaxID=33996 RepID=PSD_GLUDA|nr:phosphatidylserine decarboxylase [Gluconacetobacter diazotrophicus]A9H1G5.1 RecName: Full=Phosphatidylserine decarboxylase proenzyme; Contains: RecName: Full=Phosphatidylserine decarboxylase alpha chain; Contains: RecName: Full=Phosphatidylserine decarboxylase beta chain [Gluconacetobacter diazotrophicus PA1 5]ACI52792.1 phosphatidylserine decarboxylase related protein [Gluconacetobacter diazotrophicus PA1 5]MBB2155470.1 phosphatidylserine decarboxylase [Gluconacetobacter diazotrophicus]TWB0